MKICAIHCERCSASTQDQKPDGWYSVSSLWITHMGNESMRQANYNDMHFCSSCSVELGLPPENKAEPDSIFAKLRRHFHLV